MCTLEKKNFKDSRLRLGPFGTTKEMVGRLTFISAELTLCRARVTHCTTTKNTSLHNAIIALTVLLEIILYCILNNAY